MVLGLSGAVCVANECWVSVCLWDMHLFFFLSVLNSPFFNSYEFFFLSIWDFS
jgi:hypothetical protein